MVFGSCTNDLNRAAIASGRIGLVRRLALSSALYTATRVPPGGVVHWQQQVAAAAGAPACVILTPARLLLKTTKKCLGCRVKVTNERSVEMMNGTLAVTHLFSSDEVLADSESPTSSIFRR
jgi:hypothetical protein